MHISEGFLSGPLLAAGWTVAGAGIALGLKKFDTDTTVRVAMTSSVFFLASLINVKVGPSSTHLSLVGPMGLLLGWGAFPAIFTALLLQAVLFQSGGLLVLGANTVSMATSAVLVHLLFGRPVRAGSAKISALASFFAGGCGVVFSIGFLGLWLTLSDPNLAATVKTLFLLHLPLAVIEGIVTLFMTSFLRKTAPDILKPTGHR